LFAGLDPQGIVIVAVSGGSDSLALLLLANAWAQAHDITLHAVTIDHGLRPEAAAEAAFVAALCEGLSMDHTTLAWEGVKPLTGLPEAARNARYALIEEFARDIGSDLILTGHTLDDQAETMLMRIRRLGEAEADGGSTSLGRGLAAMPARSVLPGGTLLARPLLGIERDTLRAYLATFGQSWIEDPTNSDTAYERVRVRRELAADRLLKERLAALNLAMTRWRALLARDTAALLDHLVSVKPGPVFLFDLKLAQAAPEPVLIHAVQVLLAVSGGGGRLVPRRKVEALVAGFGGGETGRMTLGGAVIERDGALVRFFRETRGMEGRFVDPGDTVLWDGRVEVANASRQKVHVGPLTRQGLAELERARGRTIAGRPRAALHSSARITTADGTNYLPMIETHGQPPLVQTRLTARAIEHFCPDTDFPLLEWLRGIEVQRRAALTPK
jgi:tRNA(Ile)-lysidine synthase